MCETIDKNAIRCSEGRISEREVHAFAWVRVRKSTRAKQRTGTQPVQNIFAALGEKSRPRSQEDLEIGPGKVNPAVWTGHISIPDSRIHQLISFVRMSSSCTIAKTLLLPWEGSSPSFGEIVGDGPPCFLPLQGGISFCRDKTFTASSSLWKLPSR